MYLSHVVFFGDDVSRQSKTTLRVIIIIKMRYNAVERVVIAVASDGQENQLFVLADVLSPQTLFICMFTYSGQKFIP